MHDGMLMARRTLLLRCLGPEERVIGLHMVGIAYVPLSLSFYCAVLYRCSASLCILSVLSPPPLLTSVLMLYILHIGMVFYSCDGITTAITTTTTTTATITTATTAAVTTAAVTTAMYTAY